MTEPQEYAIRRLALTTKCISSFAFFGSFFTTCRL
jgi:hypothetical protein